MLGEGKAKDSCSCLVINGNEEHVSANHGGTVTDEFA